MIMDLALEGLLREHLMVSPLLVIIGITEQLVTMGAEDFKVTFNLGIKTESYLSELYRAYNLERCTHCAGTGLYTFRWTR